MIKMLLEPLTETRDGGIITAIVEPTPYYLNFQLSDLKPTLDSF